DRRHDALLAAARFIDAVNRVVTAEPGAQRGTVGRIAALPGAANLIAGKVTCTLELRDMDRATVDRLFAQIQHATLDIVTDTGTSVSYQLLHENIAAPSDARVRSAI